MCIYIYTYIHIHKQPVLTKIILFLLLSFVLLVFPPQSGKSCLCIMIFKRWALGFWFSKLCWLLPNYWISAIFQNIQASSPLSPTPVAYRDIENTSTYVNPDKQHLEIVSDSRWEVCGRDEGSRDVPQQWQNMGRKIKDSTISDGNTNTGVSNH